jgi:uncharacterized protein
MQPTAVMSASPLDRAPARPEPPLMQLRYTPKGRWVPSRFNARTVTDDGRMMVWNTLTGAAFELRPEHRETALALLAAEGVPDPLDSFGQNLAARGFLVPSGADEMARFRMVFGQQQWRPDLLHLILLASEDCNFRCVYCYEKFRNGTMLPEVRQGVRQMVERRAARLRGLSVGWFGGEPLYGWEAVEELAPYFRATAERHGLHLTHAMTTNAYLLTEEKATKLLEWGCNDYQITIDGVAEDHDCKRVGRDGSPTHAVILDNLRSMAARRGAQFTVAIRVNFDRENFPRLGPFLEALSEDFGGDPRFRLRFRGVGKWGGPNDDQIEACGLEERRFVKDDLRKKALDLGLRAEGGIEDFRQPGSAVCYAARPYSFIVGATGKLMKCTIALDDLPENVVGRLAPDGTLELDDFRFSQWVTPHFETDQLCQSCYVLPGCQGAACPLTRIRDGERTCCSTKANLKREMKFSMDVMDRARAAQAAAAPAPEALAAVG